MEPIFRFGDPAQLYWLLSIPAMAAVMAIYGYMRRSALRRFADSWLVEKLMPEHSLFRTRLRFVLLASAAASIAIGLARPRFGDKLEELKREGIELAIALDVSNSMLAEDIRPNRLESSKRAILQLLNRLSNDKVALIVFAGDAYVQLPMTADFGAAKLFLNTVNTNFVEKQGTAIGAAINLAARSFTGQAESGKAIIIISDGEDHEDDAVGQAKQAAQNGITVHTIGMGLQLGAPIPVYTRYGKDFRKDRSGNTVLTKLNEPMLQDIAAAGAGMYIRASNASAGLAEIYDELSKMQTAELDVKIFTQFQEKFQYWFAAALLFLLAEILIPEKRSRFSAKFSLFKTDKNKQIW
jgi:Ca-activated chloride channel homolog